MTRFLILMFFLALTQVHCWGQEAGAFTLEADEEGVEVFVRPETDGQMSVRVLTSAYASVAEVQAIIDDAPNYPQWVHRCVKAYVLAGGAQNAYTYYSRLNLPFPLSDREVVAAITQSIDPESGTLIRNITSTPDALPATKGCHREEVYEAEWIIKPLSSTQVSIQCTVRTAAGANLPNWLRREVMTGGPVKTVKNLVLRLQTE